LARRSSRWTRRVAETLWTQAQAYKEKRSEKRAEKKAATLPSQLKLTDQSKQPSNEPPRPETKKDG